MTVHQFTPDSPRRGGARKTKTDELREALADLVAFYYMDDMICEDRPQKWHAAIIRARSLLPGELISAAMDRLFIDEATL